MHYRADRERMSGFHRWSRGGVEQAVDECDLSFDAGLLVMDVAALDGSDGLYPSLGRFGRL